MNGKSFVYKMTAPEDMNVCSHCCEDFLSCTF